MTVYVGVDPGKSGFISLISKELGEDFYPMPTEKVATGEKLKSGKDKMKTVFSEKGLLFLAYSISEKYGKNVKFIACIEEVIGRNGWSAQNNFNFGYTAGLQKAFLHLLGAEVHMVRPQKWQSVMYEWYDKVMIPSSTGKTMIHDTKATSAIVAKSLAPNVNFAKSARSSKIDDNKTDAFLISKYCEKTFKI